MMMGQERLLLLAVVVTATSALWFSKQKTKWAPTGRPSPGLMRLRQRMSAIRSQTRPSVSRTKTIWSRDSCRVEAVVLRLQPPIRFSENCSPTLVETFGCRGRCPSYSQVSHRNSSDIIHSCTCCQPLGSMTSFARIPCRNGRQIRVPVKRALGCSCRPCYTDRATKDTVSLRDLLTKAAVNTPFPLG